MDSDDDDIWMRRRIGLEHAAAHERAVARNQLRSNRNQPQPAAPRQMHPVLAPQPRQMHPVLAPQPRQMHPVLAPQPRQMDPLAQPFVPQPSEEQAADRRRIGLEHAAAHERAVTRRRAGQQTARAEREEQAAARRRAERQQRRAPEQAAAPPQPVAPQPAAPRQTDPLAQPFVPQPAEEEAVTQQATRAKAAGAVEVLRMMNRIPVCLGELETKAQSKGPLGGSGFTTLAYAVPAMVAASSCVRLARLRPQLSVLQRSLLSWENSPVITNLTSPNIEVRDQSRFAVAKGTPPPADAIDLTTVCSDLSLLATTLASPPAVSDDIAPPPFITTWLERLQAHKKDLHTALTKYRDVLQDNSTSDQDMVETIRQVPQLLDMSQASALEAWAQQDYPSAESSTFNMRAREEELELLNNVQSEAARAASLEQRIADARQSLDIVADSTAARKLFEKLRDQLYDIQDDRDKNSGTSRDIRRNKERGKDVGAAETALCEAQRQLAVRRRTLNDELKVALPNLRRYFPEHKTELDKIFPIVNVEMHDSTCTIDDYAVEPMTHGAVLFATERGTGAQVAIKQFTDQSFFVHECRAHRRVQSPFVGDLLKTFTMTGDTSPLYCAVLRRYPGGTLDEWVKLHAANGAVVLRVLMNIAEGVAVLHSKDVVHCDIKPANIVMTTKLQDASPKIIDFDRSAADATTTALIALPTTVSLAGTTGFTAPELEDRASQGRPLTSEELQNLRVAAIDVFSLGRTINVLLGGSARQPWGFPSADHCEEHRLCATLAPFKSAIELLMRGMLQQSPTDRMTSIQVRDALTAMYHGLVPRLERETMAANTEAECSACYSPVLPAESLRCASKTTPHVYCAECLAREVNKTWGLQPLEVHANRECQFVCSCGADLDENEAKVLIAGSDVPGMKEALDTFKRIVKQVTEQRTIAEYKAEVARLNSTEKAILHIDENILILRCPGCQSPSHIDYTKCMRLTCTNCTPWTNFCGYCGVVTDRSRDPHLVPNHILDHGMGLYTTSDQWHRQWVERHRAAINGYLATQPPEVQRNVRLHLGIQ